MEMSLITAVVFIMLFMVIGEIISAKTKAFIPSVFVTAVLFIIGYWTFFPKDIVSIAALGSPFANLSMFLLVTHMGSLMNIRELLAQLKTIIISLAGILGIIISLLTVGSMLLGKDIVIAGAPPLTGGIVAALLMQNAAADKGLTNLAVLAILVYVAQGFVGYPVTAILLKREGKRLLSLKQGNQHTLKDLKVEDTNKKKIIPPLAKEYNTTYMLLLKLSFVAFLAFHSTNFLNIFLKNLHLGFTIHPLVTCLIFGVIFTEIGFLDQDVLKKSNSFGITMTALMAFIFDGLKNATPQMLSQVALPLFGVIFIGVIGLIIFSMIAGFLLKESIPMSICIAMNALYGFPPNFILTTEAINSLTKDEEERDYLSQIMIPKMLVGGFTSVTIVSVIIGGIFVGML